jgi:isopentenyldiphosphate isomerase/intracellular septation protein A
MSLSLLKKLLPGFLPVFIFVLADEIWGTRAGLYVALAFGVLEFAYYFIKERKTDWFILLDTGLLLILGIISIILDNDLFFKIKPAFVETIMLAVIAFSIWGPGNIIMAMSQRYLGEIRLSPIQEKVMRRNMIFMFCITATHIILVLYSAKYMSKEAWAFISGGLFYIMFVLYFAASWIINYFKNRSYKAEEWFPVVDEEGTVTGKAPRRICHDGKSKLLHPVVHMHLFNSSGKLFLQKRAANKDIQPGKWDTSAAGHITPGETVENALSREVREEIGIHKFKPQFITRYVWESPRERELVFSFITVSDEIPVINRDEIEEGRFWTIDEINRNIGKNVFTPNFEQEFMTLARKLSKRPSDFN